MRNLRDFITIRQAADMIGVSPATLRNWDRSGKLKAARNPMNRYRLYRREDLDAFLACIAQEKQTGGRIERATAKGDVK